MQFKATWLRSPFAFTESAASRLITGEFEFLLPESARERPAGVDPIQSVVPGALNAYLPLLVDVAPPT